MGDTMQLVRTSWALQHPLLTEYYDTEWGMPVLDERGVFERIVLESFQSGLAWLTILQKRDALRHAFAGFQPDAVATFTEDDVQRMLMNSDIIRNRRKIEAAIKNAQATVALRNGEFPHLGELVWSFIPELSPCIMEPADFPSRSPESELLAAKLKQHGFSFVGPTTVYALMAAIGMVDLHAVDSYRRACSGLWNVDGTRTVG